MSVDKGQPVPGPLRGDPVNLHFFSPKESSG